MVLPYLCKGNWTPGLCFHMTIVKYFMFFAESNEIDGISSDTVSLLPSLKTLDLGFNKFIKILGRTLQSMPRIRRLKLSNNYINEIDQGAFHHLQHLGKFGKMVV